MQYFKHCSQLDIPNDFLCVDPEGLINQNKYKINQIKSLKKRPSKNKKAKSSFDKTQCQQEIMYSSSPDQSSYIYINSSNYSYAKNIRKEHIEPFQIFCLDKRAEIVKMHPNLSSSQITSIMGTMWRSTSQNIKQYYNYMSLKMSSYLNQNINDQMSNSNNSYFSAPPIQPNSFVQDSSLYFNSIQESRSTNFDQIQLSNQLSTNDFVSSKSSSVFTNVNNYELNSCNQMNEINAKTEEVQISPPPPPHLFIIPRSKFNMEISKVSQKCLF